ncbi:MAG: hypothetical protein ACOH2N_13110 [Devosia sp.]
MRKFIMTMATAGVLGMAAISAPNAAPVAGYEALYSAVSSACTIPAGTLAACETAINAYSGALASAVDLAVANASFTALRAEVFAINAPNPEFQAQIDALFELLLPDSGALGTPASPA